MTADPWAFGWDQFIDLANLIVIVGIAIAARRTFESWKKQLHFKRMSEAAVETLVIFDQAVAKLKLVRHPLHEGFELESAARALGGEASQVQITSQVVLSRIKAYQAEWSALEASVAKTHAIVGKHAAHELELLVKIIVGVQVAAQMLPSEAQPGADPILYGKLRQKIWSGYPMPAGADEVPIEDQVNACRTRLVAVLQEYLPEKSEPISP